MAEWLDIAELADLCGRDSFGVREELGRLGLADGAAPTTLALRHSLATAAAGDSGRQMILWHEDLARMIRGPEAPAPSVQGDLFETFDALATPTSPATPDDPATSSSLAAVRSGNPVGTIVPGFDAIIATDGACSGNPGPGGWAWVEQISGAREAGGAQHTTNNVMELTALIRALEYVGPQRSLLIRADSTYVINVMTKWAQGWRRRGWKKADGNPVANRELVERLLSLYEARTGRTQIEWVKGHAGDAANELVDSLAVEQSRLYGA